MLEARLGHRELDEDAVARDRRGGVVGDDDAEAAHAGELAGVAPERTVAGGLERRDEAQVGRVSEAGDEATAHAAGGAGDDDVRHGDARARAVTSRGRTS